MSDTIGLDYAHKENVIHRDVKPANILFIERKLLYVHIKLADFTLFIIKKHLSSYCGSKKYRAPDISKPPYTAKIDIWSVGVIRIEL